MLNVQKALFLLYGINIRPFLAWLSSREDFGAPLCSISDHSGAIRDALGLHFGIPDAPEEVKVEVQIVSGVRPDSDTVFGGLLPATSGYVRLRCGWPAAGAGALPG